ncbi:hypothetical protein M9H77_17834 [Catharanthus roseus]|uniref:Uncharacterized protein n=1 Tax=Catharanthus roseus TaxID=4058 RepID=A0ACC0B5Q3_CATRO|nr:hypothetical protein M9H77_17834 [Catharanthus roseus]
MLGSVTLDLDPVDRGRSIIGGLGPRRRGPSARIAQGGLYFTYTGSPRIAHVHVNSLSVHRSCFPNVSPLSKDLVTSSGYRSHGEPSESAYWKFFNSRKISVM